MTQESATSREGRMSLGASGADAATRFGVSFAVLAVTLFTLYSFPYSEGSWPHRLIDGYLSVYARAAGAVLGVFDRAVIVVGQEIVGRYALRIIHGCDAMDVQILLVSAVLASSGQSLRWRLAGALAGFALITVFNVARICSLYCVGIYLPAYFDVCHHEFWPLLLVAVAVLAFLGWLRLASRAASSGVRAAALAPPEAHGTR